MEYNASDEIQVEQREKEAKNERDQELEDIKTVLKTPAGLRLFKRLMEKGHIFNTTFTGNSQTYFLEGHRNFALLLFNDVCEAIPEMVVELMTRKED